jgi:uncharacterized protein (TIGR02466 family)
MYIFQTENEVSRAEVITRKMNRQNKQVRLKRRNMLHGKDLFTTQIYYKRLSSKNLMKELKQEAYHLEKVDTEGQHWSQKNYPSGYTSYGSNQSGYDRLHQFSSTFAVLNKKIDQHVKKYIQTQEFNIELSDLVMTHCWINIMGQNARHSSHNHPLSVISGTYYVQTSSDSSVLRFEDPRMGFFMNTPPLKTKTLLRNQRIIDLQPKNEHVVLFESWLKHEVVTSASKKDRISISFNYGWR